MAKKSKARRKRPVTNHSRSNGVFGRMVKLCIKLVTITFAVIGFVSSIFALFPRVSLIPEAIFDKNNPMKCVFTISNDGFLPIYDLDYEIATLHLDAGGLQMHGDGNVKIIDSAAHIPKLKASEKASVYSIFRIEGEGVMFKNDPEIQVVIHFRPFVPLFRQTTEFRFIAKQIDDSGKWQWFHKAVEKAY
jgi:hypothetical protein